MASYTKVYNSQEYVQLLMHICTDLPTKYNNHFPYNLGYYNSDRHFSWDCWNLVKSILWGWTETKRVGYYQPPNPSIGLGDWAGGTIMNHCSEKSTDFSHVTPGEFLMNQENSHAGTYVGEFTLNGRIYNVVECTVAFGGGVVPSYVASTGARYSYKGGSRNGSWYRHGKLPWIDYSDRPAKDVVDVDGWWGVDTTRYTQKMFGTIEDGIVSFQAKSNMRYLPRCTSTADRRYGSWDFNYRRIGSAMVKAVQQLVGAEADGQFGPKTVVRFKTFLQIKGYYSGELGDVLNADAIKAWQRYLNDYFKTH